MPKLGLIGFPLSHSFSPSYFKEKFEKGKILNWEYKAYPLETIDDLNPLLKNDPQLIGLNVTIPYKEKVIPFLDDIDEAAAAIGAVNTILKIKGKLKGFNTDIYGFKKSLVDFLGNKKVNKALILGTGGAAKAVEYVLQELEIESKFVSRNQKDSMFTYEDIDPQLIKKYPLIINTTPLGTYPNVNDAPELPYAALTTQHFLYDLVYNPSKTLFLSKGELQGTKTINGLQMLHLQAEKAWEIWTTH